MSNPAAAVIVTNASCFGEFNGTATALVTGGIAPFKYQWLPIPDTTQTATNLAAGTYTATVTDSLGCPAQTTAAVSQPTQLVVTATSIANMARAFTSGGTAPYTYQWYPPVSTTSLATGLSAGIYTITVHDANLCSDSVLVSVREAALSLFMVAGATTCNPGYFTFYIKAFSDSVRRFNNCVIDLNIGSEFYGDSISNGYMSVTQGLHFQPGPGNDYNILNVTNLSPDIVQIQFGDTAFTSPNGTLVGNNDDTLLQVSLKIRDCGISAVSFTNTDTTAFESYYTLPAGSPYSWLDSALYVVCTGCICDSCDFDNTCYCYLSYCCYDSLAYRYYDTTLYTSTSKNIPYIATNYTAAALSDLCYATILNFTSPVMAGTNAKSIPPNSSILNITGLHFGTQRGTIHLSSADAINMMIGLDSTDILYWCDTLIKVKVPSLVISASDATPGTGQFYITTACSPEHFWAGPLQINYSILNDVTPSGEKLRPDLVMANDTASFYFECDTSVSHNPQAFACVKKALREWNCYTGVNWKLLNDTDVHLAVTKQDSISDIYFGNFLPRDSNVIMSTKSWYNTNTCYDASDSVSYKDEADIAINRRLHPGYTWDYDTTGAIDTGKVIYFYDAILHELGHGHGLGHINDLLSLMYLTTQASPFYRPDIINGSTYPAPATFLGAMDMIYTSVLPVNAPANFGCNMFAQLDTSKRFCSTPVVLSVPVNSANAYSLSLFPNPINGGDINIAYNLTKNSSVQFNIVDCTGRIIIKLNDENKIMGEYTEKININNLATGVYLFTANINGELQVIKFIKL